LKRWAFFVDRSNGNQSLYLDFYFEGKRKYEFLKLYLIPETSAVNRAANRETLKLANTVKAQKIVELQNNRHGFSIGSMRSTGRPAFLSGLY
jgi:hypothetical protein